MKKILSFLALLMVAFTTAWAGEVATFNLGTKPGTSTPEGFFKSVGEKWNFNNKFTGGEYDGISFSNGLKMEGTTKIGFTTEAVSTVTIVQSTWSDKTIKLDDVELAVADAVDGTGCRIYTVTDVAAGDHNITRGSGESGLFYVKVEWETTKTVTFINDANWTKVYVWAWNSEENFTGGTWPGVELTEKDADGNYTWSTTGSPTGIIFNDGGSNQTADLVFKAGGVYKSTGRVVTLNNYTATFKTDGMTEAWAYVWNGDEKPLGDWPGTKMEGSNGEFSIAIQAEEAPKFIIFHNNTGDQTDDLAFEDGKAYEYMLNEYAATFTTDAEWATVNAYAWSGEGDNVKKFAGEWPGTALTAANGVYSFSVKAFKAPEKIIFNNGEAQTPDLGFINGKAYKWITATPFYALSEGATFAAGTTVDLTDATITYGVDGGADFGAASATPNDDYAGFTYMTGGNGENGAINAGTVYTIVPKYNGTITVGVRLNGGKKMHINEDGTDLADYAGITIADAANTSFTFDVKANSTYKIWCDGSKLGFFGFDYKYDKAATEIKSMAIVGDFTGGWPVKNDETGEWDWSMAKAMTQDADNAAVWTLTLNDVEIEGKKYEYKAAANNSWDGYQLPAEGNQDFIFGTDEYPAGTYNLTFTANTDEHTLTLDVEAVVKPQIATFNFADPNFRENIGESMTDTKGYIYNETFTADGATLLITAGSAPSRVYVDSKRGQNLVTYKEYTTLTFRAPEGKAITKIEFTAAGSSNINNFTASSGTIDGMTWTGNADGVRFAQGGTSYLANAVVTLTAKDDATAALPAIEYTEVADIAAFNALEAGTYAKLTLKDAEVIGKSADGYSTVWVQDATGGAWIQYTSLNDKLQESTKVNGTVYTVKRATSGNPQLKEAEDTPKSELASEAISAYTTVEGTIAEVNVAANLNKVVKISGAKLEITSATAGKLTVGETTINVNNGAATANQQLHKIADWENGTTLENVTITAILVATSATDASKNQLLPISIEQPVVISSMAIVGDFTGGWPVKNDETGEWDWSMAKAMTQSTDNAAVWTLTLENVEVEGKKYEYKAAANNSWDDYKLPDEGNADFVFGTEKYPAGKYNLTFTADTENHNLTLDVEAVAEPVVITSMAIVGDFLGLEATETDATPNWNPANGWAMTQSTENPAIWTLTKRFVAEAKTYEYKATANGNWTDCVVPAGNNANYNFDTADLGAGKYILTFTANTDDKTIELNAEKVVSVTFPENATVFDFGAAAAAGENPGNKNGSAAAGQAFYGWENSGKTDSKRQDYKGYEWAEGSVLPADCHVWRRSDRINGNVKDEGLYCPNDREMAVDGLKAGDKVIVVYDALDATNKELVWAIGDGSSDATLGGPRATATIAGVNAVIGETTIASGAEILVNSVTPAENGTGYIVFQVKKGMYIQQIAIVPAATVEEPAYYLVGTMTNWVENGVNEEYKLTLNSEAEGVEEYMITLDLKATDQIKVVKNGETLTWYPDGTGNAYGENGEIAADGNYTVYFRPNGDGGDDWFNKVIYVAYNGTVGINAIANNAGNAVIYNMQGQRVQKVKKGINIVNGKKIFVK